MTHRRPAVATSISGRGGVSAGLRYAEGGPALTLCFIWILPFLAPLLCAGCLDSGDSGAPLAELEADAAVASAQPADEVLAPSEPTLGERFYSAYLAETVDGDRETARAGYKGILARPAPDEGTVQARAALRLAELYADDGRHQEALDLVGRAMALGGDDPALRDAADTLRLRLASAQGDDVGVRGPAVGTVLDGVSAEALTRFRKGEKLLVAYLNVRVRSRPLELSMGDQDRKKGALDAAVRAYGQVVDLREGVASAAASFRIASLYHDAALKALALDVPPELNEQYRREERARLYRLAGRYFKNARAEYASSLAAAPGAPGAELWHAAARSGNSFTPP